MARVLILSSLFAPDGVSTATIISELALELQAKGHDVTVIASVPRYSYEPEARSAQPLTRKWGGLYYRSSYHGIPVWHTSAGPQRERGRGHTLAFLLYSLISLFLGLFAVGRRDAILVVSPPLTEGVVGWFLALVKRAKYAYNVQELHPEGYILVGAMRRESLTARIMFAMERFVYQTAHALVPICAIFADYITERGVASQKIHIIPNFVDVDFLKPGAKDNPLARELGLVDSFVVLYAGNIGLSQSFDTLLEAAERLRTIPDIVFLIVGDGARRAELETLVKTRNLTNIRLLPYQPRSRVPDIYATASVGLVPLMAGNARTTLPSKLYTIMATGCPALVAVDLDSDIVKTVQAAACGLTIPPDDADALVLALQQAYDNPAMLKTYGENGRRYALENYSRQVVAEQYHALVNLLANEKK